MMKRLKFTVILCLCYGFMMGQKADAFIYVEINIDSTPLSKPLPDSIAVSYIVKEYKPWSQRIGSKISKHNAKWCILTQEPILLLSQIPVTNGYREWMIEPGDSIIVYYKEGKLRFSGNGADKLILANEIATFKEALQKPSNETFYATKSVSDYLEWKEYLNHELALIEQLIQSYSGKLSPIALNHIKLSVIESYEDRLRHKFMNLKMEDLKIDKKLLCQFFDIDFFTPQLRWFRSQPSTAVGEHGVLGFNRLLMARQYNFPPNYRDPTISKEEFASALYQNSKNIFQGHALEYALAEYLTKFVIKEIGFVPATESLLEIYYNDKERNPEFQDYVKNYIRNARMLKNNKRAAEFTVYDAKSRPYTKADLKDKVALLHFWKTGDPASAKMVKSLKKVETAFKDNPNVVFLHISADKNQISWLKSIKKATYTTGMGVNTVLGNDSVQENIIKQYNITEFPALVLINFTGRIIRNSLSDSLQANAELINLIEHYAGVAVRENWQGYSDGPYVVYGRKSDTAFYFEKGKMAATPLTEVSNKTLSVATDEPGKTFQVKVRSNYIEEPSVFPQPEKLFAFSDIEGNFDALRLLLQKNKVIDEKFNWTFGKGHLVFAGDMFDRGEQVTECLWLLYELEERAKAAGGYVHFILGNHELMNLNGDSRYARTKYKENAANIGIPLIELYGRNSELGKWLRTKNIVEKIGDILLMHGGMSKQVNDLGLTVEQINELARPFFDKANEAKQSTNPALALLFDSQLSPYWYREYYLSQQIVKKLANNKRYIFYKTPLSVIDEVLKHYNVNKIVTGHTIFEGNEANAGKHITVHYDGKVINTDTEHARGHTEALLIENNKYYSVNKEGGRQELFNTLPPKQNNVVSK